MDSERERTDRRTGMWMKYMLMSVFAFAHASHQLTVIRRSSPRHEDRLSHCQQVEGQGLFSSHSTHQLYGVVEAEAVLPAAVFLKVQAYVPSFVGQGLPLSPKLLSSHFKVTFSLFSLVVQYDIRSHGARRGRRGL